MRHDMELCDQSEKIKTRLGLMDRGNGEERARSRSMDQRGHMMIWSGSYHLRKIKSSVDS